MAAAVAAWPPRKSRRGVEAFESGMVMSFSRVRVETRSVGSDGDPCVLSRRCRSTVRSTNKNPACAGLEFEHALERSGRLHFFFASHLFARFCRHRIALFFGFLPFVFLFGQHCPVEGLELE